MDPNPVFHVDLERAIFRESGMALSATPVGDAGILWETTGNYNDATLPGNLRAFRCHQSCQRSLG